MIQFGHDTINEPLLVQQTEPLFDGHRQPRTYCLGDSMITQWDDADESAMSRQVELMQEAQLDFVIFDSYGGSRQGDNPVREIDRPHDTFLALNDVRRNMQFATMWNDAAPRANLPTPIHKGRGEPGRRYDLSIQTAQFIIDQCATRYWDDPGHLQIKGRPYLSFTSVKYASTDPQEQAELEVFIHTLKDYAQRQYRVNPYLVTVAIPSTDTPFIKDLGMDAVGSYAYLPDVRDGAPPVQSYSQRVKAVMAEWDTVPHTFVPSAVVGWDSSPRGENGYGLEEVAGVYPYTPIIVDDSPDAFSDMLQKSMQWTRRTYPWKNNTASFVPGMKLLRRTLCYPKSETARSILVIYVQFPRYFHH